MTTVRQDDFITSVADALQFISYYHPLDYIEALGAAYEAEQSPAAKDAIAQILTNSRMSAEGHRPICQDTGIVVAFVRVGMNVEWDGATMSIADGGSDCGRAGKRAVAGFWTMTVPPASLIARAPDAPSEPMPVSTTAITRSASSLAALDNSRSIDGLGPLDASRMTRTVPSAISIWWFDGAR